MLDLVDRLREGFQYWEMLSKVLSEDEFDRMVEAIIDPLFRRIAHETPVPTTELGALEALRFLIEQERIGTCEKGMTTGVLRAVLAFFEGRSAR